MNTLNFLFNAWLAAFDSQAWTLPTVLAALGIVAGAFLAWRVRDDDDAAVLDDEGRRQDLDKRRATVVDAVRALDSERDKLAPEDYERERRALLAHGAQALKGLEEGALSEPNGIPTLLQALQAERETLGDDKVAAIEAILKGEAPVAAKAAPPTIGPRWEGALWTLGAVAVLGVLFLALRGMEGTAEMPVTAMAPPPPPPMASTVEPGEAEKAFMATLESTPTDLDALNGLTDFEIRRQGWDKASEYNARALAVAANDAEARTWDALLTYRGGAYPEAINKLDSVIQDHPTFGRAMQFRGIVALNMGQSDEALQYFERALEHAEDDRTRFGLRQLIAETRSQVQAASAPPELQGTITLAEGVDPGAWGPQATVFVSVRAASGPPMPLRAKKLPPGPFPMSFSLSPADAPMRGGALPDQVVITVKVDLDGNAMGDDPGAPKSSLEGVKPGTGIVNVVLGG